MTIDQDETTDRRVLRGQRNRAAVVEALISLVEEGDLAPTANQIAERAGLSLRSIYHHFSDLESLQRAVADQYFTDLLEVYSPISTEGTLESRLASFGEHRLALFERTMPVYRSSLLTAVSSPGVADLISFSHDFLRVEVAQAFEPELADGPPWRLDALDQIASIDGWVRLRITQGLTADDAQVVTTNAMRAVLVAS